MHLKRKVMIMVFLFMLIPGTIAGMPSDSPKSSTDKLHEGCSIFLFQSMILDTSYLSGNSDSDSGSQDNVYLQPAGSGNTGGNLNSGSQNGPDQQTTNQEGTGIEGVLGISMQEKSPGITSEQGEVLPTSGNAQFYGGAIPGASTTLSKIPLGWKIGCLVIDAVISGLLLYLAVTKRI
jgi:hypothetical protein